MTEYIKTAGDLRRGVAHLADDEPIEFFLNAVETHAYFAVSGVEGGDAANLIVEPNYTCGEASSSTGEGPLSLISKGS